MAQIPRGQPRSVPDKAGEQYDREMAQLKAERSAREQGGSLLEAVIKPISDLQNRPKIARPSVAQTFIPVVGPAWEAAADFQDRDYVGVVLNAGSAAMDLTGGGAMVFKGGRALSKGVKFLNEGSRTADSSRKVLRRRGLAKKGQEIHHTLPLNGLSRNAPDYRNHYMFLKIMPEEQHRRLRGRWGEKPKYGPAGQIWYGTNAWQKGLPAMSGGHAVSSVESATHGRDQLDRTQGRSTFPIGSS